MTFHIKMDAFFEAGNIDDAMYWLANYFLTRDNYRCDNFQLKSPSTVDITNMATSNLDYGERSTSGDTEGVSTP